MHPRGSRSQTRGIFRLCKEVVMGQEHTFDGAVKDHHFDLLVSLDCRDDLVQLRNGLGTEDIERWVVERDSPVRRRAKRETYLRATRGQALIVHGSPSPCHFVPVGSQRSSSTPIDREPVVCAAVGRSRNACFPPRALLSVEGRQGASSGGVTTHRGPGCRTPAVSPIWVAAVNPSRSFSSARGPAPARLAQRSVDNPCLGSPSFALHLGGSGQLRP